MWDLSEICDLHSRLDAEVDEEDPDHAVAENAGDLETGAIALLVSHDTQLKSVKK